MLLQPQCWFRQAVQPLGFPAVIVGWSGGDHSGPVSSSSVNGGATHPSPQCSPSRRSGCAGPAAGPRTKEPGTGAALRDPWLAGHPQWARDRLGSPLEDGGMTNEPQDLSRSRRLLKPMCDMKVDAILGARQGQLAASSSLQWLCPLCCAQFLQHPPSPCAARTEQQVKDHRLLELCLADRPLQPRAGSCHHPCSHPSLTSHPFQMALYFCTGVLEDETLFRHYALNVPFYTHFTSPIRRYADVIVHRLLSASLGGCRLTACGAALGAARGGGPAQAGLPGSCLACHGCWVLGVCVPRGSSLACGCPQITETWR